MDDYLHAAKVGRNSAVELAQSYLKCYAATWWRTMRQEEGKNHGYTWEFFKDRIEAEFIPKNSDYISRCKLRDLMNAPNENLRQYVRAYSELMLEVRHMHEMDRVCQFDALLGPGVNPLEGSPNVKLRKLGTKGHTPGFQL
jgi:hypothetical protein